jgi:hypothetical protein
VEAGRRTHYQPAHASPYPETETLDFGGGEELLPFSPEALEDFEVLEPGVAPEIPGGINPRETPVDLIHVPVWLLRYRLDGAPYYAVVHGGSGELLDFNGPPRKSSPGRLGAELLGFLAIYTGLALALPGKVLWGAALLLAALATHPPPFIREMR